jgi:hypothetical protein
MLTIFALPKAFTGHIATIQSNAITSWSMLSPKPEIILFGDEQGTADFARRLGLRHVPKVKRNEHGTPRLDDIFENAQDLGSYDRLCYVNADIVLLSDFMRAAQRVASWRPSFLMIGRRWNLDLAERIEFERNDWEECLRNDVSQRGIPFDWDAVDYFFFSRGLLRSIPRFVVGRPWWDGWMVWRALSQRVPVVDASRVVMAVHQNHAYDFPGGLPGIWDSQETKRNLEVAGGIHNDRGILDATYRLEPGGRISAAYYSRWCAAYRRVQWRAWFAILGVTRPLRHLLGIRRQNLDLVLHRLGFSGPEGGESESGARVEKQ